MYRCTHSTPHTQHTHTHLPSLFECVRLLTLTLLQPSLHRPLFSLFRDVVSGRCRSAGVSGSHWLQQSAVCQLQQRPPSHPGGPRTEPGSGVRGGVRWTWWHGHKSCGTLLTAQRSLVGPDHLTCEPVSYSVSVPLDEDVTSLLQHYFTTFLLTLLLY